MTDLLKELASGNVKYWFGAWVISIVAILQCVAWILGHNGTVYSFTSLVIGTIAGAILGIKLTKPKK